MSDYTTNASVVLQMNGEEPKKVLDDLRTRAHNLENAIAKAASAGNKVELGKLRKELKTTQRQIRECESATQQVETVLQQLDKATPKNLQRTLRTLEKQLNNLERGSEEWKRQTEYIKRVRAEIDKVNRELREGESLLERLNRKVSDWQNVVAGAVAVITGLVMAGRSAVNAFADMDAEMANVRKFTGMTADEVKALNQEFLKIDTRTSREELNKLAQEAGRLGKTSQEDVLGFVKAADQINVALDDLGEGATLTLSKLTSIFGDEERLGTERSLLAVGSVINELSQNCTASAGYLAQFAQRLAGVGAQAGMTIPQIMAFAAVLDSQGQAVEMSATAMSQLIMSLFKETEKIAKATGMNLEKFKETLNRSTNEGLLMLLDRLHELGGMDVLAPVFSAMGENGARASAVISALAGNVEMVRWEQVEANKAFQEATSVTKEFTVQNTTVQAGLDKAKKRLRELAIELGEKLAPVMRHVISSTTLTLRMLSALVDFIAKYKSQIILLTATIVAYQIAVNLAVIKTKLLATWQGICQVATIAWTVATKAGAVVVALFSGNITKATVAFKALAVAMRMNPFGLFVSAITAVVGGLTIWLTRSKQIISAQEQLQNIENMAQQNAQEELSLLKLLYEATQDQNRSLDDRKIAVEKLQEQFPDYFKSLDVETILVGKAADEYKRCSDNILAKARAEARQEQLTANEKEILRLEQERDAKINEALDDLNLVSEDFLLYGSDSREAKRMVLDYVRRPEYEIIRRYIEQVEANYNPEIQQYKQANKELAKVVVDDMINDSNNNSDDTPFPPPPTPTTDKFKKEKEWREREEALNRIAYAKGEKSYQDYTRRIDEIAVEFYNKQLLHTDLSENEKLSIQAQYHEAVVKQTETGGKLSLDAETKAYNERLAEAKQFFIDGKYSVQTYNEAIERIESEHLQKMVRIARENGTPEQVAEAERNLKEFEFNSAQKKRQQLEQEQQKIQQEQARLKQEFFGDNSNERQAAYDKMLANLKWVYEAELKAVGDNATEKLRIDEAYQKAKLALQKKYGLLIEEDNRNRLEKANEEFLEWLQTDAGKAVTATFDTVMSGMSAIFSQVSSLVQSELQIQTSAIEKRYDKEISLAEGNTYQIKRIEKQKEEEIAKAKNEANKKLFAMQVIQAIAQTAQNALSAYGSAAAIPVVGFVLAPIAAAMAIAAGALQIAAIKKQQQASQAQGYSKGGFTKPGAVDEPAGIVHAGEWVASQKLLANPVARPLINSLDHAQRTNTIGSLRASDVSRSITAPITLAQQPATPIIISTPPVESKENNQANERLSASLDRLNNRLNEPFVTINTVTGDTGIKKAQDDYEKLIRNKSPKSKRK